MTQDKGEYHGEESRVVPASPGMGLHRTRARLGGQADDAAEVPSRNGCNVLGRDGTAVVQIQKGRCGYAPDI